MSHLAATIHSFQLKMKTSFSNNERHRSQQFKLSLIVYFSRESDSRIANVRLSVSLSVSLSVTKTPLPLRIAPIIHQAY